MPHKIVLFLCLATLWPVAAGAARFADVTQQAGVAFTHGQAPDHRSGPMGGGGCVGDFDNDGFADLFVIGGGQRSDALFMNQRDGSFTDRAVEWGLAERHRGTGCAVADYDSDGDADLFVTSMGPVSLTLPTAGAHRLYRNDGTLFREVAQAAGVHRTADYPEGYGAAFGDIDLDGDLDLFVAGWHANGVDGAFGSRLFRNRGDGTFEDVTADAGVTQRSTQAFGAVFVDMDGDRYPELLVAGDFGTSRYYRNDRDGGFTELDPGTGSPAPPAPDPAWSIGKAHNGMGTAIADFDRDGRPDWFITAIWPTFHYESPHWGNGLYLNRGQHVLQERTIAAGVADGGWGWGVAAFDADHDGRVDIAMTNGWPATDEVTGEAFVDEPADLFVQRYDGVFREQAFKAGLHHRQQGRGLVTLDYDRDGDLDLAIFSNQQPLRLYRNEAVRSGPGTDRARLHWLQVQLTTTDRPDLAPDGHGAHVMVRAGDALQHAWLHGGGTYLGGSENVVQFGLHRHPRVDELIIDWPDGQRTLLRDLPADQRLRIAPPKPAHSRARLTVPQVIH